MLKHLSVIFCKFYFKIISEDSLIYFKKLLADKLCYLFLMDIIKKTW